MVCSWEGNRRSSTALAVHQIQLHTPLLAHTTYAIMSVAYLPLLLHCTITYNQVIGVYIVVILWFFIGLHCGNIAYFGVYYEIYVVCLTP